MGVVRTVNLAACAKQGEELLDLCVDAFAEISSQIILEKAGVLAESCLTDSGKFDEISHNSYFHPLGYHKIVMAKNDYNSRIRLHRWSKNSHSHEDVHDHYWDFRSVVARGCLKFTNFDEHKSGEEYNKFAMLPIGMGKFELIHQGRSKLRVQSCVEITKNGQTSLSAGQLHSARCIDDCWSVVLQSPKRLSSNTVFRPGSKMGLLDVKPERIEDRSLRRLLEEFVASIQ